jgi:DNA-binding protein YbaB
MFDKLKQAAAMADLMRNKDKLREAGDRVKSQMEETRVIGTGGNGAARAVVTGTMRVLEVELTAGLVAGMAVDEKTRALAGSLIAEAVNDGLRQAQLKLKEALDGEAKALGLEGLPSLPGFNA